jgi:hypothetical protein
MFLGTTIRHIAAPARRCVGTFAALSVLVIGLTAGATNASAVTIGPEVLDFANGSNPAFSCPKNKPCISGLTVLANSGESTELEAAASIFGFSTDELIIWDKADTDNGSSGDGNFDVESNVSFTSAFPDRPDSVNKWSLNSDASLSFDSSTIVGFAAKFGNYTGFFGFRAEDLPLPADLTVLFYDLEFYDQFLDIGLLDLQNNGKFGGLSHVTVFGTLQVIPLPAALPLAATGLAMIGILGWRKRAKAA